MAGAGRRELDPSEVSASVYVPRAKAYRVCVNTRGRRICLRHASAASDRLEAGLDLFKSKATSERRARERAAARQIPSPLGRSVETLMREGGKPEDYRAAAAALSSLESQEGSPEVRRAARFLEAWCESQAAALDRYYPSPTIVRTSSQARPNYRAEGLPPTVVSATRLRMQNRNQSGDGRWRIEADGGHYQRPYDESDRDERSSLLESLACALRAMHLSKQRILLAVPPDEIWFAARLSKAIRDRGSVEAVTESAAVALSAAFLQGWSGAPDGLATLLENVEMPVSESLTPVYLVNCSMRRDVSPSPIRGLNRLLDVLETLPQHGIALCSIGQQLMIDVPLTKPSLLSRIPPPSFQAERNIANLLPDLSELLRSDEAQVSADALNWTRPVVAMFWDGESADADQLAKSWRVKEFASEHPEALVIHYVVRTKSGAGALARMLSEAATDSIGGAYVVLVAGEAAHPIEHLAATLCVRAVGVGVMAAPGGWSLRPAHLRAFAVTPTLFLASEVDPFLASGEGFQVLAAMKAGAVGWGHGDKSTVIWVVAEPALDRFTIFIPTDKYPIDAIEGDMLRGRGFHNLGHGWRQWCTKDQVTELIEAVVGDVLKLRSPGEIELRGTRPDSDPR